MKIQKIFLYMIIIGILTCFAGCSTESGNSNNNKTPPPTSNNIIAPYLISFGTYLSWENVNYATEYDIYCDGQYVETISQTNYQLNSVNSDVEYYIVAKNSNNNSKKSNTVLVSKSNNYSDVEILDLSNKSSFSATIPSSVRKIIIGNNKNSTFYLSASISERIYDLTFELHNVSITGSVFTDDGAYSRTKCNYNVIFNLIGDCSLEAEDGRNGFDFSESKYDNTELDAGKGSDGGNAIVAPTVIITGSGNFVVSGGDGGDGGVGASTTTWESSKAPGKGSDGGDGGVGIKTSYFILNYNNGGYTVQVSDGKGGKKGIPGGNNSIITGPIASAMWNDVYDIGKAGADGISIFGKKKLLNGSLVF